MNILVIGQCTLHWGRMEFGNIGNYYIIEPFMRELHKTFPMAQIRTTLQMSDRFCRDEKVEVLPMDLYYGWRPDELELARSELRQSELIKAGHNPGQLTPYIQAVQWADLVIDFSGDIWGDNANFLGANRFEVGLIKDQIAMNMRKKVVMLAGSPGPFSNPVTFEFAQKVYAGFDLVTNREPISTSLMRDLGFNLDRTSDLACPAFLFEPATKQEINEILRQEGLDRSQCSKPIIGFILCGWNFEDGPFDKWPRPETDYEKFAQCVEMLSQQLNAKVCLMSHSNGFDVPPAPFKLKHGRDYPIAKQMKEILARRGIAKDVMVIDRLCDTWQTKAILGSFDMLVSGRVHAAVAGLSLCVPTVIVDYGHEPKAHKLRGFATVAGVADYVADPTNLEDLKEKVLKCWNGREQIATHLESHMEYVKEAARRNFSLLKDLV